MVSGPGTPGRLEARGGGALGASSTLLVLGESEYLVAFLGPVG
jgi:hypothetical protein